MLRKVNYMMLLLLLAATLLLSACEGRGRMETWPGSKDREQARNLSSPVEKGAGKLRQGNQYYRIPGMIQMR
jgi:hypothetical protein